jgi:hypothetical protein
MTDAPQQFKTPTLDPDGKIWPEFLPDSPGSGLSISTNANGDKVLTIAEGSTAARLTTNANGDTVLTVTGA